MNALHSSKLPRRTETQRPRPTQSTVQNQRNHQAKAFETIVMLTVNILLSVTAVVALTHLIAYQRSQQAKLQEMQTQVQVTQGRVNRVKEQFNRNFDPQEARQIMQEQTNRIDPKQRQVVWVYPKSGTKD